MSSVLILNKVHHTFDYSQAVSIPHHVCQVGPLYFATPRKVQLFGVAMEVPYHGKSLVDTGFAYIKKLYRRYEADSLDQLANVVRKSSKSNEVVVFGGTEGHWLDWKTFTQDYFLPFKGIRKYRHFVFKAENEGIIEASEAPESSVTKVKLLKPGVDIGSIQPIVIIPAAGLSADRQKYLYKLIRPFVRCPWKDAVAQPPEDQEE